MTDCVVQMLSALTGTHVNRGETVRGGRTLRWVLAGGRSQGGGGSTDKAEGPVVVLESGLGEPVPTWAPIFAALAANGPVLAYDRAGVGMSDPSPDISLAVRTADLAAVIEDAAAGPCVSVGHSLGGLLAQVVAWERPDLIAGLVLIDPTHEDAMDFAPQELRDQMDAMTLTFQSMTVEEFTAMCREDWVEEAAGLTEDPEIRELLVSAWAASFATQDRVRAVFDEEMASARDEQRARELRRTAAYPRVPVTVLSATTGMPPELRTEVTRLQSEIAAAAGGEHMEVPDAGHYIYRRQPQAVLDAIARVVDAAHHPNMTSTNNTASTKLPRMDVTEYIAVIRREGELLADAAEAAGLDAAVPTCPDWQVRDMVAHTGGVHRWATAYVARGRAEPFDDAEEAEFFVAPEDSELLAWFRSGHEALVDTLSAADPDVEAFQFLPAPSPLAFWARRQAHETAIHRADADSAAGRRTAFEPEFAADGVDELIGCFFARKRGRLVADPPVSFGVRSTDAETAWTIRIEPDSRVVEPGLHDPDCVLSGPANDLYLTLWNRRGMEGLELRGDAAVFDLWRAKARVI